VEPTFNREKLRELIVYIAQKSEDDPWCGATKLNKILFYADFYAYRQLGAPITGAQYQKLPEGPAPRELLPARDSLVRDESITVEARPIFNHVQQRVVANRHVKPGVLSDRELSLVDEVIGALRYMSARQVSDLSHDEPGWRIVGAYETIPYRTAWLSSEPLGPEHVARGLEVAQRHGLVGA
jgi:hypothetical protein